MLEHLQAFERHVEFLRKFPPFRSSEIDQECDEVLRISKAIRDELEEHYDIDSLPNATLEQVAGAAGVPAMKIQEFVTQYRSFVAVMEHMSKLS
jgi:hypothetical protein